MKFIHTPFFLLCFFFVALLFSCGKGTPDSYNPYTVTPVEELPVDDAVDTTAYVDASLEHLTFMTNMFSNVSMIIYAHPALNGLVSGTTATVRSCPDVATPAGGAMGPIGTAPLDLDFDFDNCKIFPTFPNLSYDGTISMSFDGSLGSNNSEFTMSTAGLVVDNGTTTFTIKSPMDIVFTYTGSQGNSGDFTYDYVLGGPVTVEDGTYTTTYPANMTGEVTILDNAGDDTMDPMTYTDNTFELSLDETLIVCNNGVGDMNICAKTQANKEIAYSLSCGCPQSGVLQLNTIAGSCANFPNETQFDFGSDAAGNQENECDNFIENGNNVVTMLTSCSG